MRIENHDVAIVGSGIAGLVTALELSSKGFDVALLCDKELRISASSYAQGGIAAVINKHDSVKLHVKDTLVASANLAKKKSVKHVIKNSANAIRWLEAQGVSFDKDADDYSLHLEGGHSLARILHIKDYTGKAIQTVLLERLAKSNITVYQYCSAFKLQKSKGKCIGLYASHRNTIIKILANNIVLATGGFSGIYQNSTNSHAFIGSGMVMAYDIGCELKKLEFTQFHPTCFFDKNNLPILISEAVRGAGGVLERADGYEIMSSVHHRRDLAPRDIVAREIFLNMQKGQQIYLNVTHLDKYSWQQKFPFIYQKLLENDLDPTIFRIPITPAAHYSCGGIKVNTNSQTEVSNLYAIGECSYTGLHGANRLASNSLLECIVYALSASKNIVKTSVNNKKRLKLTALNQEMRLIGIDLNYEHYITEIKNIMWDSVGLVRNHSQLEYAKVQLNNIHKKVSKYYHENEFNEKLNFLLKLLTISRQTVKSAIKRKNSVGSHYLG